jgi:CheY-like chemotaxis protein
MTEDSGVRVLILSDAPEVTDMFTMLLRRYRGDEVTVQIDGTQALADCADDPPDLILFSWRGVWWDQGYCDAAEFTAELRKLPTCADVPVLVCSAMWSVDWLLRMHVAGVTGHIMSPVMPDEFIAARDAVLRGDKVGLL